MAPAQRSRSCVGAVAQGAEEFLLRPCSVRERSVDDGLQADCPGHRRGGGHGLTTVELLLVCLLVAVLAAIAIPALLRQREQGFEAQASAGLKNGASAMESYATRRNGDYSGATIQALRSHEGLNVSPGVTLSLPEASLSRRAYCLEATHSQAGTTWHLDKSAGVPVPGPC
jgi:type IV pilus assembly protein PilA